MIWQGEHCPNCESHAREAKRWRERAEHYSDQWTAVGTKGQAIIDELCAENGRLREALDLLGVALAEHGHTWTVEERTAYEKAMRTPVGETK